MFKNLLLQFAKKALYALIAVVIAMILQSIETFQPTGEIQGIVWKLLIIPALTGLVALLRRWQTYDPAKAK